ncbi:MAG: tetratricopeptide repeat protein [Acidobacteria bacterium]|nr:tetratricopeptide repeat protein [Acidobacteriota bacterium]
MADNQRIEDLRRRVQKDPASIAFAQLAEEYRRAGQFQEAVDVCRAGLEIHPGYLSARVTLGRALIELDQRDEARSELELVLKSAPENLAALRGLAEILHSRGELAEALARYRQALALARNDPDLEQTVNDLAKLVEPPAPTESSLGLSFEQMQDELLRNAPPPPRPQPQRPPAPAATAGSERTRPTTPATAGSERTRPTTPVQAAAVPDVCPSPEPHAQALATIAALERFLDAIHVVRAQRRA